MSVIRDSKLVGIVSSETDAGADDDQKRAEEQSWYNPANPQKAKKRCDDRLLSGLRTPPDRDIGCRNQTGNRRQRAAAVIIARLPAEPT